MPFVSRLPSSMRMLPLIAGLAATGLAHADDPNPYYIGASETISHESNVFLTPDGVPSASDTLYTTSLIGGIDQPIGRERLFGNVALRDTRYKQNSVLNNTGYNATLGLDWATIDRISGNFTYTGSRTLAQFNSDGGAVLFTKNIETSQEFDATARIGVVTRLTGVLNYNYRKLSYSEDIYKFREFDQNAVSLGMNYSTSAALLFGVAYRHTEGKYPTFSNNPFDLPANRIYFKDDFKRNDIDLTTQWIPTGASTINARLSFSKQTHDAAAARDFSGTTGNLAWDWRPTGKLQFVTSLSRDTGQQSTFYERSQNSTFNATGDNSQVTNALQIVGKYALSAKVSVNATVRTLERSLANSLVNPPSGHDRTTYAILGARWTPLRSVEVGCNVSRERRTSDVLALSQPYSSNSFGCYGQLTLQ